MRDIANMMLLITRQQIYHKHGVSKNNTDVAYYNCDAHRPILICFGTVTACRDNMLSNGDLLSQLT